MTARAGRGRVVLTADEGTGALAAVRALRSAGYEPWVAVWQRETYAARSAAAAGVLAVPSPADSPAEHARQLMRDAVDLAAVAVLPATEQSLGALSEHLPAAPPIPVGAADHEAFRVATDKLLLSQLCRRAGLQTPPTLVLSAANAATVPLPVVVKPLRSVARRGDGTLQKREVALVETRAALRELAEPGGDRLLVQPYLRGTLAAVCGVAWRGRLVSAVHQISPRIWPPERGVSCFSQTVARDRELEAGVARLLAGVGWSGIFGVQFLRVGGVAYAIDLNPRVYGSLALAVAAGHNLPGIWLELLLGGSPAIPPYRVGVHYRVEEDDPRALAHLAGRGRLGAAARGLLPRPRTTHAVFSWRDPGPALVTARKLLPGGRSGRVYHGLRYPASYASSGSVPAACPEEPGRGRE